MNPGGARRVAVVGLGVATSLGFEVDEVWRAVLAGRSGVRRIRQFPSDAFPVRIGSEVDFEALTARLGGAAPQVAGNRTLAFARWAAERAWQAAGLDAAEIDPRRAATCVGAGLFPAMEDRLEGLSPALLDDRAGSVERMLAQFRRRPELASQQDLGSVSAMLSARFGLGGPSLTVHSACASATQAAGEACHMIRHGAADVVLTGGADSMMSMFCVAGFTLLGALSRQPVPEAASRPFDLERDGFVLGEGAGIVVLEELEHALRRGAPILAEIAGYGSSLDAYRFTDVDPRGRGAAECMRRALASAALRPEDVGYVNAHGTSTYQNDRVETLALKEVFGDHARRLAVSSTKSQLGHLLCAAGGVELIFTVLALRDQVLPPTINLEHPDPECDLDYVAGRSRPADVAVAISNSFGFGGQNATLAVRRREEGPAPSARVSVAVPAAASRRRRGESRPRVEGRTPGGRGVVVTGLGAVSCLGLDFPEHWRRLIAGECGVRPLEGELCRALPVRLKAPVVGLRVEEHIRNRMLRKLLLPSATFAVVAAGQALRDAGLEGDQARRERCGLYFGSLTYELQGRTFEPALRGAFGPDGRFDFARFAGVGMELVDPLLIVKGLPNAAPCGIAIEHGLRGPNTSFSNGATCGLQAAASGFEAIRQGVVDLALVGGSDSLLLAEHAVAHHLAGRLRLGDEPPWVGARPFDARRCGYVLGEGAAACVLEAAEHARARGAQTYGEVLGAGQATAPSSSADADGRALETAARDALCAAQRRRGTPAEVIFGSGPGTVDDDLREARAARRLFPQPEPVPVALTAATGALGQTGAASGAFALVHALQGLKAGVVAPTTGYEVPDPRCDVPVVGRAERRPFESALVWSSDGARNVALLVRTAR